MMISHPYHRPVLSLDCVLISNNTENCRLPCYISERRCISWYFYFRRFVHFVDCALTMLRNAMHHQLRLFFVYCSIICIWLWRRLSFVYSYSTLGGSPCLSLECTNLISFLSLTSLIFQISIYG